MTSPAFCIAVIPGSSPWLLLTSSQQLADAAQVFPSTSSPLVGPVGDGIKVALLPEGVPAPLGSQWMPARQALGGLDYNQQTAALRAIAVANWRSRNPFCPGCGAPVEIDQTGTGWVCSQENKPVFPRTDPCVITAVLDPANRLLLSHAAAHPDGLYTLVAGFVEAGESLEAAVRRETREEVGLEVESIRFICSQPWPFPASLMAAFCARARNTAITVDGIEITTARWFTASELKTELNAGTVLLPPAYSVARQTIESWLSGQLQ